MAGFEFKVGRLSALRARKGFIGILAGLYLCVLGDLEIPT